MSTSPPTPRLTTPRPRTVEPPPRVRPHRTAPLELPWANLEIAPAADHRRRDRPFLRNLIIADLAATTMGVAACLALASGVQAKPGVVLAWAVVGLLLTLAGLYRRDELLIRKTTLDEAPRLAAV